MEIKDFADTAALCTNMDLIISVDTSVAHLAGALGRPTIICYQLGQIGGGALVEQDIWYPNSRFLGRLNSTIGRVS